jgi:hypothetical protein
MPSTRFALAPLRSPDLARLPQSQWPKAKELPLAVWVSKTFQVTLWLQRDGQQVLSISRRNGRDGITWDELQRLKTAVGYGTWQAVEIYPPDQHLIYQANMRHLWLMHEPLKMQWRKTT